MLLRFMASVLVRVPDDTHEIVPHGHSGEPGSVNHLTGELAILKNSEGILTRTVETAEQLVKMAELPLVLMV